MDMEQTASWNNNFPAQADALAAVNGGISPEHVVKPPKQERAPASDNTPTQVETPSKESETQSTEDGTDQGAEVERVLPKQNGRIAVFNSKTKQFLRYKDDPPPEYDQPKEPNTSAMQNFVKSNLAQHTAENDGVAKYTQEQHPAQSMVQALEAGWGMYNLGMFINGKIPDQVVP